MDDDRKLVCLGQEPVIAESGATPASWDCSPLRGAGLSSMHQGRLLRDARHAALAGLVLAFEPTFDEGPNWPGPFA